MNDVFVNKRFGFMTVTEYVGVVKHRRTWKLKCDCGNEIEKAETYLRTRPTIACSSRCYKLWDLTGKQFSKLKVIEPIENEKKRLWRCLCECGKEVFVSKYDLETGHTKSCGCYKSEIAKKNSGKHNLSSHPANVILSGMKARCYNKNNKYFKNYGGRGIVICDEWLGSDGVKNFVEWAELNGYHKGLSIERIDVNKNYEPSNCCFIEMKEQLKNKTNNRIVEYKGKSQPLFMWCEELGLNYSKTLRRFQLGWSPEEAFELPKLNKGMSRNKYRG